MVVLLLAAPLAALAQSPPPDVFGEDDWQAVDDDIAADPYRMFPKILVRFEGSDGYEGCSGTMVGRYRLLTAGHCVFDPETGKPAAELLVAAGYSHDGSDQLPYGVARGAEIFSWEKWRDDSAREWDQAYVLLDRPLGDHTGWVEVEPWDGESGWGGTELELFSYPLASPWEGRTMTHSVDRATGHNGAVLHHQLDTSAGSSGGGILRRDGDEWVLVATHAAASSEDNANLAVLMDGERISALQALDFRDGEPSPLSDMVRWGPVEVDAEEIEAGGSFEISLSVRNVGVGPTEPFIVSFYLSGNETPTPDDVPIGFASFTEPIAPFTTSELVVRPTLLPDNLGTADPGWWVTWIIDPQDQVYEYDEGNNAGLIVQLPAVGLDETGDCEEVLVPACDTDDGSPEPSSNIDLIDQELDKGCSCGAASGASGLWVAGLALLGWRRRDED